MILTTHSVVGAAIVMSMPSHPVLGLTLAFGSHFVLDSIPHWEYKLYSDSINPEVGGKLKINKRLIKDVVRIGSDFVIGIFLSYFLFFSSSHPWLWILGALIAVLPDFLQFVYLRFPYPPLTYLQRFHKFVHTKKKIENVSGACWQGVLILLCVIL